MKLNVKFQLIKLLILMIFLLGTASAQHRDKPRPEAWNDLIHGGRFMDRILLAPIYGGLETDTWGADALAGLNE